MHHVGTRNGLGASWFARPSLGHTTAAAWRQDRKHGAIWVGHRRVRRRRRLLPMVGHPSSTPGLAYRDVELRTLAQGQAHALHVNSHPSHSLLPLSPTSPSPRRPHGRKGFSSSPPLLLSACRPCQPPSARAGGGRDRDSEANPTAGHYPPFSFDSPIRRLGGTCGTGGHQLVSQPSAAAGDHYVGTQTNERAHVARRDRSQRVSNTRHSYMQSVQHTAAPYARTFATQAGRHTGQAQSAEMARCLRAWRRCMVTVQRARWRRSTHAHAHVAHAAA